MHKNKFIIFLKYIFFIYMQFPSIFWKKKFHDSNGFSSTTDPFTPVYDSVSDFGGKASLSTLSTVFKKALSDAISPAKKATREKSKRPPADHLLHLLLEINSYSPFSEIAKVLSNRSAFSLALQSISNRFTEILFFCLENIKEDLNAKRVILFILFYTVQNGKWVRVEGRYLNGA